MPGQKGAWVWSHCGVRSGAFALPAWGAGRVEEEQDRGAFKKRNFVGAMLNPKGRPANRGALGSRASSWTEGWEGLGLFWVHPRVQCP